jgi:hypothetical protein
MASINTVKPVSPLARYQLNPQRKTSKPDNWQTIYHQIFSSLYQSLSLKNTHNSRLQNYIAHNFPSLKKILQQAFHIHNKSIEITDVKML